MMASVTMNYVIAAAISNGVRRNEKKSAFEEETPGIDAEGRRTRLAADDAEKAGRDLVVGWMREAGLRVITDYIGNIFGIWETEGMMEKGLLREDDPEMLAFAYTTPISALIHLCDREPEKTEEAIKQVEAFSRHFIRVYGRED